MCGVSATPDTRPLSSVTGTPSRAASSPLRPRYRSTPRFPPHRNQGLERRGPGPARGAWHCMQPGRPVNRCFVQGRYTLYLHTHGTASRLGPPSSRPPPRVPAARNGLMHLPSSHPGPPQGHHTITPCYWPASARVSGRVRNPSLYSVYTPKGYVTGGATSPINAVARWLTGLLPVVPGGCCLDAAFRRAPQARTCRRSTSVFLTTHVLPGW